MYIFLDTNIFYSDLLVNKANFKYLFSYINNNDHTLLLSNLVIEETENIRSRELATTIRQLEKTLFELDKLSLEKMIINLDSIKNSPYNLLETIKTKTDKIEVVDYNDVSQKEVVARALKNRKPFGAEEKGYRDTLIWLSLLKFAGDKEIFFISNNSSDFYQKSEEETKFHQILLEDIIEQCPEAKIKPYKSLFDFIKSNINKDECTIDHLLIAEALEEYAHYKAIEFIENFNSKDLSRYLENPLFDRKIDNVINIKTFDLEGVEGTTINWHSKISEFETLISYFFDLRRFFIEIEISTVDYLENKDDIDKTYPEIELYGDSVILKIFTRPYFDVAIVYNHKDDLFTDFSVSDLWLRYATLGELTRNS